MNQTTIFKDLARKLSQSANHQKEQIRNLQKGIHLVETITQNYATTSEKTAAVSEELSTQSESVNQIVNHLEEIVNGKS